MKFTTLQLMYDVVWDKQRRERIHGPMTETQVADAYLQNITFADGAEKVSVAFVGCACTMNDRVLNIPKVKEILLLSDQGHINIFDGWTKLQTIIGKARTPDNILWAFMGLYDAFKMGFITELGLRLLQGTGPGMNGRGIVDLLLYKKGLLQYLLGPHLEIFTFKWVIKAKIRHVLKDHETERANCTGWPGNNNDLSWQGGWPKAAQDYLVFVEGLVYNQTHDMEVKLNSKNRKAYEDLLSNVALKDEIDEIVETDKAENAVRLAEGVGEAGVSVAAKPNNIRMEKNVAKISGF
jgi:hypothetical protein